VLADIAIFGGVIVAVVASLDLFLSDKQKDEASNQVLRLWNWIDEVKNAFSRVWSHRHSDEVQGVLSFALLLITGANLVYYFFKSKHYEYIGIMITLQLLSICLAIAIVRFTLAAPTLLNAAVRITTVVGIPIAVVSAVLVSNAARFIEVPSPMSGWYVFLTLGYLAAFNLAMVGVAFWAITALPVVTLLVLSATLFVVELIARRLAEYRKGPIIGGSVLLAFVGGTYKALH